jgi:hypothetical protein
LDFIPIQGPDKIMGNLITDKRADLLLERPFFFCHQWLVKHDMPPFIAVKIQSDFLKPDASNKF